MIEGHYDTFDRAKFTFIESIYDGIGKADAAAEYYFASLNLQRHGYRFEQSRRYIAQDGRYHS